MLDIGWCCTYSQGVWRLLLLLWESPFPPHHIWPTICISERQLTISISNDTSTDVLLDVRIAVVYPQNNEGDTGFYARSSIAYMYDCIRRIDNVFDLYTQRLQHQLL